MLERQASYRFYSSSLLVIYDGKECRSESYLTAGPRCVSNTWTQGSLRWHHPVALAPVPAAPARRQAPSSPPKVDVRMIDFAHSTFKGFRDDPTVHDGPDRGYVFGLENLISIMEQMRDENQ